MQTDQRILKFLLSIDARELFDDMLAHNEEYTLSFLIPGFKQFLEAGLSNDGWQGKLDFFLESLPLPSEQTECTNCLHSFEMHNLGYGGYACHKSGCVCAEFAEED